MVPSVPNHTYELPTYREREQTQVRYTLVLVSMDYSKSKQQSVLRYES